MKKLSVALLGVLCLSVPVSKLLGASNSEPSYTYYADVISSRSLHLWVTYKNLSKESQCIRSADLDFDLYADSLLVKNHDGVVAKYIGPSSAGVKQRESSEFTVVYPGRSVVRSIYLKRFYDLPRLPVSVSYAIPVVSCERLFAREMRLPETPRLKSLLNEPGELDKSQFVSTHPDWAAGGFVAVMTTITIEKGKQN